MNISAIQQHLITGGEDDPFLPHLWDSISAADEIDMAVAFIKTTGLKLILPELKGALTRNIQAENILSEQVLIFNDTNNNSLQPLHNAKIRIITSDYLDITDPEALRMMMLLQEHGAQIKIFETAGSSFHMKAYIFAGGQQDGERWGKAFVGSSNISRQALREGLEWNYKVDLVDDTGYYEIRQRFNELFINPRALFLSHSWIDNYQKRRRIQTISVETGSEEFEPPPDPHTIQLEALQAIQKSREEGFSRGLVVLATGLGKTWLAAFDIYRMKPRKVLFVAHREEILQQAAGTLIRILPDRSVGYYTGQEKDENADVICASVQTIGKMSHLEKFSPNYFDYIVIDEFHHSAAPTYHKLLHYFNPKFLLGLTATPQRTDNANILSLCDDNLIFEANLFEGINKDLLIPFDYYGIYDETVDYQTIPWRSGRFDPNQLSNKLATLARARHGLNVWRHRAQTRTLAFCVSVKHADFMADYFCRNGVPSAAVYAGSKMPRSRALELLGSGELKVVFSVDLFNEGIDLPSIDTVMMLRPTESKILFLQQFGRGLRKVEGKEKLVIIDFVGNHHSFLNKPQALMGQSMNYSQLADFAQQISDNRLSLPKGCFINYDIQLIDFLKSLRSTTLVDDYNALKDTLGRRPNLIEFYRYGCGVRQVQKQYGSWFEMVESMGDLSDEELSLWKANANFLRLLESEKSTKGLCIALIEAFTELEAWTNLVSSLELSIKLWTVIQRRRELFLELPEDLHQIRTGGEQIWQEFVETNLLRELHQTGFFASEDKSFRYTQQVDTQSTDSFSEMVQQLIDYRLVMLKASNNRSIVDSPLRLMSETKPVQLPFFPNLKIACGHFKTGTSDEEEYINLSADHGPLDSARHFIAKASGNSMDGGRAPIKDGDLLLLEDITPDNAGPFEGSVLAIEKQDITGENQYLLRRIIKDDSNRTILRAQNRDYQDIVVTDELMDQFRTFARLKKVLEPLDIALGKELYREEIPPLFGTEFNPGKWNSGHVVLNDSKDHILFITLSKKGKAQEHRYVDHWIDSRTFHWQSQASTTPELKKGREIIQHESKGITIHLFVREEKLRAGKASPFRYYGPVIYKSHTGSKPMSIIFELMNGAD